MTTKVKFPASVWSVTPHGFINNSFLYRYAQDNKKEGDKEGIYWLEKQKMKCQAMQKSLNSRAKALDPHKSLEEAQKEKSKQIRSVCYPAQK